MTRSSPRSLDQFSESCRAGDQGAVRRGRRVSGRAATIVKAEASFKKRDRSGRRQHRAAGVPGGGVRRGRPQHRGGQRVADRAHRRLRLPADLPVARRRADARARPRRRADDSRRGGRQVAVRPALHQAAGAALRHVRPGPRGGANARAIHLGARRRSRRLLHGRPVDLHRALGRRRRAQPRGGPQARPRVRGRATQRPRGPQLPLVKQWVDYLENEGREDQTPSVL